MRKMKTDIYVCSKPLQYFNARNVPKSFHPGYKKILVVITYFYNAEKFVEMILKSDKTWDKVVQVSSVAYFYKYLIFHHFDSLIYGYDTSTVLGLIHMFKKYDFYVLEEGTGTYLPDDSGKKKNIIQTFVDSASGVSTDWGHTKFVKGAFVYYPNLYKLLRTPIFEPYCFSKPFADKVREDIDFFMALSDTLSTRLLSIKDSRILLYITDWSFNLNILEKMNQHSQNFDYAIVKPHPHINNFSPLEGYKFDVIKTNLMVEFILSHWLNNNNKITIYHEGSTSIFYYRDYVDAIDLSPQRNNTYHKLIRGEF